MHYCRMLLCPSFISQRYRTLANPQRLDGIGVLGRRSRLEIPEGPRGPSYKGLNKQRRNVMIIRVIVINSAHLSCIVIFPTITLF